MAAVFISHRGQDSVQAEQLGTELRAAGHKVWLDTWAIAVGDSVVQSINDGLEAADYVVVCFSSAGAMSPWMNREWMSALHRQLERHGVRLLPVLLTGRTIPAILSDIKYADLMTDWKSGMTQLLRAIR
jgi:TIR domain